MLKLCSNPVKNPHRPFRAIRPEPAQRHRRHRRLHHARPHSVSASLWGPSHTHSGWAASFPPSCRPSACLGRGRGCARTCRGRGPSRAHRPRRPSFPMTGRHRPSPSRPSRTKNRRSRWTRRRPLADGRCSRLLVDGVSVVAGMTGGAAEGYVPLEDFRPRPSLSTTSSAH
jgi:hypothetical protein